MKRSMWFFGLLLAVAGLSSFRTADIAVSRPDRAQRRSLAKLERSYEYIRKMYVDSVDMAPLVEEAIRSMVQQLDPHTEYASAAEMAEFWSLYRGKFGGIGIQTQWIRDSLVVTSLLSGGAAEEAERATDRPTGRADKYTAGPVPQKPLGHADHIPQVLYSPLSRNRQAEAERQPLDGSHHPAVAVCVRAPTDTGQTRTDTGEAPNRAE